MLLRTVRRYSLPSNLSKDEVRTLLNSTHWSIQSLTRNNESVTDNLKPGILSKLLKLSGLPSSISKEREEHLLGSLRTQMGFINHLYDNQKDSSSESEEPLHSFRLLVSDHRPGEPLTLNDIKKQIQDQLPDANKGETSAWGSTENSKLNLKTRGSHDFFTVKSFQKGNE